MIVMIRVIEILKKACILICIALTICNCKKDAKQTILQAGVITNALVYIDINPNILLDSYKNQYYAINIGGKNFLDFGGRTFYLYDSIEVNYLNIDTIQVFDSPSITYYTYAMGTAKPNLKNDIINASGKWTNYTWSTNLSFSTKFSWNINEKKYIGFRYLQKNNTYHYGWVGIIPLDSTKVIIDDYAYEK